MSIPLSSEELQALEHTLRRRENRRCTLGINLMIHGGVLPQELLRLKGCHVNTTEGILTVPAEIAADGRERRLPLPFLLKYAPLNAESTVWPQDWYRIWCRIREQSAIRDLSTRRLSATYRERYLRDL